jgi:fucose permease
MRLVGTAGILPVMSRGAPASTRAVPLALASLGFVSLGLPEGMLGVAWPSIRASFGLPLDALGLLLAPFATGYFVSSAVSGRVLTRLGIGRALAISCGLTGLSLLGYALSPAWLSMIVLAGVLGVGAGTIDAGVNTYAAVAHGARVLNWMHAAFGLGAAIGPLIMTAIIGAGLAWNIGYAAVALAQLGLAAGYWRTRQLYARPRHPAAVHTDAGHGSARALLRNPVALLSMGLFFVYVGLEAGSGQWSFSLFTLSRGTPVAIAGVLVSAYWASLTVGRVLFGVLVNHFSSEQLLRACMLMTVVAAGLIWLNVPLVSWLALAVLGLVYAPVFPVLIADTPSRFGGRQTATAIGLQVAAAVAGGAALPGLIGVLAARISLEVVGPCLVVGGLVELCLYERLVRRASAQRRNERYQSSEAATVPPGA